MKTASHRQFCHQTRASGRSVQVMLTLKCQEMEKELKLNEVMALLTGLPGPAKEEKPADSGALQLLWFLSASFAVLCRCVGFYVSTCFYVSNLFSKIVPSP